MPTISPTQESDKERVLDALNGRVAELAGARQTPKRRVSENRLFALLIGVDRYASKAIGNLSGAVADAERMRTFLVEQDPPVRSHRITSLKNEQATAGRIIESLCALCDDEGIHHGDPILIYYAGHGSKLRKPADWPSAETHIQCLTPHDARIAGDHVDGVVLDLTFGAVLHRLADAKGNNITVILDCCHSGSATRITDQSIPRGVEFKAADGKTSLAVSASYQRDFWDRDGTSDVRGCCLLPAFANTGLQSHTVLAACASNESAYEDRHTREGRFTAAFLRAVRVGGTDTMTYSELMRRLEILPSQTPQCEGRGKDTRILFDRGIVQRDRPCHIVERIGSTYTLYAGEINGVSSGATFAVYSDRETFASGGPSLGELTVDKAGPITSLLLPMEDSAIDWPESASEAVAVMIHVGQQSAFRVHVDALAHPALSTAIEALAQEVLHPTNSDSSWVGLALSSRDTAHLSLIPLGDAVQFEILDQRIRGLGLERLNGTVSGDSTSLRSALRSAAHFFYHLRSSPMKQGLSRAVDYRVHVLEKYRTSRSDIPITAYKPTGELVDVKSRDAFYPEMPRRSGNDIQRAFYGVDVINTAPKGYGDGLFVWMFYFDCSTLEIARLCEPPIGKSVKPPLPAGMDQPLPLNFGDAGGRPLTFALPKGRATDVGFIRIFFATQNANLLNIAQRSVVRGTLVGPRWTSEPELWDVITIPVVMK
ncbi:unnamed protein product [Peniophora sp. CBMAI 1063]|nr:unnamed protein product [Peniophora sp. CBMAI 1063]